MRRRWKVSLVVAGALLASAALGFAPLVRRAARQRAAALGAEATIGSVRPGRGRIWLRDVDVRSDELPGISTHLDAVEVELAGLRARRVVVHGGWVSVEGEVAEVASRLAAWRQAHAARGEPGDAEKATGPELVVRGVAITWRGAVADAEPVEIGGLRASRTAEREALHADHVSAALGPARFVARDAELTLIREDGHRRLDSVAAGALALELWWPEDTDAAAPPGTLPGVTPAPSAPGRDAAAQASGRGAVSQGAGRDAAAQVGGRGAAPASEWQPNTTRAPRLRALFTRIAETVADALPDGAHVGVEGLDFALHRGGSALRIGPARLTVTRDATRVTASLAPGAEARGTPLSLDLELPISSGDVSLRATGGPISLAALGLRSDGGLLVEPERAEITVDGTLRLIGDASRARASGKLSVANLSLMADWLAPQPVHAIGFSLAGDAEVALDGSHVRLDGGSLTVGKLKVAAELDARRAARDFSLSGKVSLPLAACDDVLRAFPRGLAPALDALSASGTLALDGEVTFDSAHVAATRQRWSFVNECRFVPGPEVSPTRFAHPWTRDVVGADGRTVQIESGPGSAGWVPYGRISPHMTTALLICEDGHFFSHQGFDFEAIQNSLRANLEARRFVRGASTLSMQLAKNLYLSREKTVTRKLQEAFLTLLLEQELGKERLLELYLNVIELGPGLYGIGPAAWHYFRTNAADLSLGQALYLASILPSPKVSHFGADGHVAPGWAAYLRRLMGNALRMHRIDQAELEASLAEEIVFGVPAAPRVAALPEGEPVGGEGVPAPALDAPDPPSADPGDAP